VTEPGAVFRGTAGLLDRSDWMSRASDALAATGNRASALLLIDLDGFPALIGLHGDPAGDTVLRATAAILTDALRSTDVTGRHGGDEFLVLLPARDRQLGEMIARRIRSRIRRAIIPTISAHGEPIVISGLRASIGVAIHDPTTARTLTLDELIRQADAALLAARTRGGDQLIVAGTTLNASASVGS
jgi:diguanylate cyclase (GGDEF)-like protein